MKLWGNIGDEIPTTKLVDENGADVLFQAKQLEKKYFFKDGRVNINALQKEAVPFRKLDYTIENFKDEFPSNKAQTPFGEVYIQNRQFDKLNEKGRERFFGLIKPTLEKPTFVVEFEDTTVFFKSFRDEKGIVKFASITKDKNGIVDSVSNYDLTNRKFELIVKQGKIVELPTASMANQPANPSVGTKIIPQKTDDVNTLSKEQRDANLVEWHKDSHPLTKNEDGIPKVFYHGTNPNILFQAKALEDDFILNGKVNTQALAKYAVDLPIPLHSVDDLVSKLEIKDGKNYISTPIGDIDIKGDITFNHLLDNTHGQNRLAYSGGFVDTFKDPLFIVKSTYRDEPVSVFYKPFKDVSDDINLKYLKDKSGSIHLTGYAIDNSGNLVNTTFFDIGLKKLNDLIKVDDKSLLYKKGVSSATANANADGAIHSFLKETIPQKTDDVNELFQKQSDELTKLDRKIEVL
jgi:hypothetical protein